MTAITRTVLLSLVMLTFVLGPCRGYAEMFKIGGTGAGLAIIRQLAIAYEKTHGDTSITVLSSLGSSGGIKAVAAGVVQLAVSSRELKAAEQKQGLVAMEFARTPFVFAVSTNNPVENITLQELVDIYSGKTAHWPDGTKIRIVLRPLSDADSKMVKSMSPAMAQAKQQAENRRGMLFAVTDQDTEDNLERIPGALGATSLGQMLAEQRRLKALALDGVRPSPQNLANGSYRYAKVLFLVTSPKTPSAAQRFAEFVHSKTGREILVRTGYWVR
jgi:phosphate transport system substrate-binding protein